MRHVPVRPPGRTAAIRAVSQIGTVTPGVNGRLLCNSHHSLGTWRWTTGEPEVERDVVARRRCCSRAPARRTAPSRSTWRRTCGPTSCSRGSAPSSRGAELANPALTFRGEHHARAALRLAADPVLSRLAEELAGLDAGVLLCDQDAIVVQRWVSDTGILPADGPDQLQRRLLHQRGDDRDERRGLGDRVRVPRSRSPGPSTWPRRSARSPASACRCTTRSPGASRASSP